MRLSDVLSKNPSEFQQVEGFMKSRLACGKQRKLENTGAVLLNFFCQNCNDMRTFTSSDKLFAVGVDNNHISIDCALKCVGCNENVTTWFLLESEENIFDAMPSVRILKKAQRYSGVVPCKCSRKIPKNLLN